MSTDVTPAPAIAANPQELVAFANCELIPISETAVLAINRNNGRQQMMSPAVVQGLDACTEFRTITEHARVLTAVRPELQGKPEIALQALEVLLANGMLLRATDVAQRFAGVSSVAPAPSRVFVITCDRPAAVERLLESMLRDGKLSRHESLFLVDDSRHAESRAANRELVASFNTRSPTDMRYVGEEAQRALLDGLIALEPSAAAGVRFLLDPAQWARHNTYGRARTLCLLLSVGYRAIVMDDDVLCQALLPPRPEGGMGINYSAPRQAVFFADRNELMRAAKPAGFDPLAGHASLLGRTVGAVVESCAPEGLLPAQLHGVEASLASTLQAATQILVTQSGCWGDPGTASPHWVLNLDDSSIGHLLAREQSLVEVVESRCVGLGSARASLLKLPVMSQMTGLDNTALLPPYFPAFRGEDRLFGAMTAAMHPHAAVLEYPWCVPHLPLEQRHYGILEPIVVAGGISLLIRHFTESLSGRDTSDPLLCLQNLARAARALATRGDSDLLIDYRATAAREHAEKLGMFTEQLRQAAQLGSGPWEAYVRRALDEVQKSLTEPQSPLGLQGIPAGSTEAGLLGSFRQYANGFAEALEHWAAVREASVTVAARLEQAGELMA